MVLNSTFWLRMLYIASCSIKKENPWKRQALVRKSRKEELSMNIHVLFHLINT